MEFRLLVESNDTSSQSSFLLEEKQWTLSPALDLEDDSSVPLFACISYLWGPDREPHALVEGLTMSTHTRPSLAAAIRTANCTAFWTDVFCIPHTGAARQSTLENMGYIYSRATEVIIVLGESTYAAIEELQHHDYFSESALHILESDEWVSSVWTYQEIVNGGKVYFVSERQTGKSTFIECEDFFNALGYGLSKWEKKKVGNSILAAQIETFPHLTALETIFADWMTAGYTTRSALSIFTSIAFKRNANPANYYYALLGTLTLSPQQLEWNPDQNLAERIMAICEDKNDFSFIYTVAARDSDPKHCWRPLATPFEGLDRYSIPAFLRPLVVWDTWGEMQSGRYDADGFWLDGMTIMEPASTIGDAGKEAISLLVHQPELRYADEATLRDPVLSYIRGLGFEGAATPIAVTEGLIFTLDEIRYTEIVRLLISTQVRWPMGAPGLVHLSTEDGKKYVPCAFIGSYEVLDKGDSVLL